MKNFFKNLIYKNKFILRIFLFIYLYFLCLRKSLRFQFDKYTFTISNLDNPNKVIQLSIDHLIYGVDIIDSFDYYFEAVRPSVGKNFLLVDYSRPQWHTVKGFDLHPIFFNSLAEPLSTTSQYLSFANLNDSHCVLDLGCYSGLTSIIFRELVGSSGRVIAVEADKFNYESSQLNFDLYSKITGKKIDLIYGAVWNHDRGLNFSSEGSMGSSASDIIGDRISYSQLTPSFTLNDLVKFFNLDRVDFIKCDIEGAESVIFKSNSFFKKFKPRIIMETHIVDGKETSFVIDDLINIGYTCNRIVQNGVKLPLYECYPIG